MCGRYQRKADEQRIAEAFSVGNIDGLYLDLELAPNYNVAPQTCNRSTAYAMCSNVRHTRLSVEETQADRAYLNNKMAPKTINTPSGMKMLLKRSGQAGAASSLINRRYFTDTFRCRAKKPLHPYKRTTMYVRPHPPIQNIANPNIMTGYKYSLVTVDPYNLCSQN
jgi:hypothetical protein